MKTYLTSNQFLFWLIAMLVIGNSILTANPFARKYVFSYKGMELDGDLFYHQPFGKPALDNNSSIEIWLEHKMESLGYGDVRSNFYLRPFETSIYNGRSSTWIWSRPGGGQIIFDESMKSQRPPTQICSIELSQYAENEISSYATDGVALLLLTSRKQMIVDSDWELLYENGSLVSILTPSKNMLKVSANGKFICSIFLENRDLINIEWYMSKPHNISYNGNFFSFFHENSLFRSITLDGKIFRYYSYNKDNLLLESIDSNGERSIFGWQKNKNFMRGDSSYVLPFRLSTLNKLKFSYINKSGKIFIECRSDEGLIGRVDIVTRYDRIISIKENNFKN